MKHTAKRGMALLLALVMCISLLSGLTFTVGAVEIDYVYGDPEPIKSSDDAYTNVIANWGQRGTTATYLSQNAEAFYTSGNTYDDFKLLTDTDGTATEYNNTLYNALKSLMTSRHTDQTDYDSTRPLFAYTDCQNSDPTSDGAISAIYSGAGVGPEWDSGATWNREHTWPNSKGLEGRDEDDIMMLRPEESSNNSSRGNKAYGESSGYYDPNSLSDGKYNVHGDVARIMLYVYVRWGNTAKMWGNSNTSGVMESLDVLLKWIEEDPVDTWELGRNDSVESITGTRNVFVDYPELAFLLFNEEVPNMVTPSGEAAAQDNAYTITAVSSDMAKGSVSLFGNTITAFPESGYVVSGYQVTSGTADVVQNGNVFTVTATSDCTVTISFDSNVAYTVSFSENDLAAPSLSAFAGDSVVMPAHTSAVPTDYTFLGWVQTRVDHSETKPTAIYAAGDKFAPSGNTAFYALYQYTKESSSGSSNVFELYTGAIEEGNYLIVSNGVAMKAVITSNRFQYNTVHIDGNQATSTNANEVWKFEEVSEGVFTFYNESVAKYASATGTKNQGKLVSSVSDDYAKWTIAVASGSDTHTIENVGNKAKNVNYTLRRNSTYGFAPYATITGTGMSLYKQLGGTAVYTTATGCVHVNAQQVNEQASTCKTQGYSAGVYCDDCATYISGHALLPLDNTNHEGDTEVRNAVAATQDTAGYTGDTWCLSCETEVSKGEVIPAISAQVAVNLATGKAYADLEAAINEAKDTNAVVQVKKAVAQDSVSVASGVILDLNGYTVGTLTAVAGEKLQLIDTANDDYSGYGTVTVAAGSTVETVTQAGGKTYVAISEGSNQYSVHRVEAKIDAKVLRYTAGLNGAAGFRASFTADQVVADEINGATATSWGWTVGISEGDVTDSMSEDILWAADQVMLDSIKTFAAGGNTRFIIYKDILEGEDPSGNAQKKLWAKPYVMIDGVKVEGTAVSVSLQELVNAANGAASDTQLSGIKAMLQSYVDAGAIADGQNGWTIGDIMAA